ncbi:MAG: lipopolysaccharide biosynthesis protein [Planctomycetota bacterium]|jgi:O-antigen/teichoic acid export membrane protein
MEKSSSDPSEFFKADQDIFSRAVKGGLSVLVFRVFTQALSFGRWIALARFLEVEDIGLLGVGMLMMQILDTFVNTGFQAALIQKKEDTHVYLNSAWTVGIIRAVFLFLVLYFAAPYAARLKVPAEKAYLTINICRVIGLSMLITAFGNVGTVYFQKEMRFGKYVCYQASGTLINSIVTILIALEYRTVWALVIGRIAGTSAKCFLSYMIHPYRPKISLDFAKTKELWNFGKWIFGGTVFGFCLTQGDDIFIWAYLGISALALYQMAYRLSNIPATEITNIIGQITFPAFSKMQDDIPRLKNAYLKVLQLTAFLSVPVAGLIFILTPEFVTLFLKEKWLPMIPAMQILAAFGLSRSLGATRGPIFQAVGQPSLITKIMAMRLILLVVLIYPLTRLFGIAGTAMATLLVSAFSQPLGTYFTIKILRPGIWEIFKPILYPLAATAVMLAVMTAFRNMVFDGIQFTSFFVLAAIGMAAYTAVVLVCDKFFGYGILRNIQEQLKTLAK